MPLSAPLAAILAGMISPAFLVGVPAAIFGAIYGWGMSINRDDEDEGLGRIVMIGFGVGGLIAGLMLRCGSIMSTLPIGLGGGLALAYATRGSIGARIALAVITGVLFTGFTLIVPDSTPLSGG